MTDPNLPMLQEAALKLKPFLDEVVFVGGATLGLLITDSAGPAIRATNDVDVIAEIFTYADYISLSERLRREGFTEDTGDPPLICRWRQGGLILDVLPLEESVLGYTNRWYPGALAFAQKLALPSGLTIRVITAPYLLGTKMEAFRGRGKNDYFGSHDLEDFIALIDGRSTIVNEIDASSGDLRRYLAQAVQSLLRKPSFMDALPGFLTSDSASQERLPMIERRLQSIARLV